jgi:hypothetical protein
MRLICYPTLPAKPLVRPARPERAWMDRSYEKFAYRCLPIAMANAHGWEILTPYTIEAQWNGGAQAQDVQVWSVGHIESGRVYSHFGEGVLTFDPGCVLRTEPGYNLWVTGPVNEPKDAIGALSGVVETDWAPYSFTMNWRFTRPGRVRFEKGEPFCFFFPVARGVVDTIEPEIRPMASDPELAEAYQGWVADRMSFSREMREPGTRANKEQWQKKYMRGLLPDGRSADGAHQTKVRPRPFAEPAEGS